MVRKLVVLTLLATLAACTSSATSSITGVDEQPSLGGGIYTSGG